MMEIKSKSYVENFPDEILKLKRFFSVGADKSTGLPTGWNKPANQGTVADVARADKYIGFDTCGHGKGENYALIDFDNVTDLSGKFLYPAAEAWLIWILQQFRGRYCERSISGRGLHILCKPTPGKFKPLSGGRKASLIFDKEAGAKIEIFYASKGRYCLLTGDLYPKAFNEHLIAGEEAADTVLTNLLACIEQGKTTPYCIKAIIEHDGLAPVEGNEPAANAADNATVTGNAIDLIAAGYNETQAARPDAQPVDTPEYDLFRSQRMLDVIKPVELSDSDWLAVNSAAKNIGVPYDVIDAFNRRDPKRYDEEENRRRYDSCTDPSFDIETLHGIAKRFSYSERDTQREWHDMRGDRPRSPAPLDNAARAGLPGIDEVFADDADLAQKLKDWQEVNGTIAPAPLTSIHDAVVFLKGLSVDNITADIANSSRFKEAVALCQFYETGGAQEAVAKVKLAKDRATAAIRAQKKAGGEFVAEPDIALTALTLLNIEDWQRAVRTLFNTHKRAHKSFQELEARRKAQEKRAATQEAQLMKMENARERLGKLKALPKTPERDTAIIETIKELCSWRLDSHDNPIKIEDTQANADLIFANDPNLDGLFAYDLFVDATVFKKAPPWDSSTLPGAEWKDNDDTQLRVYINRTYTDFKGEKTILDNVVEYANTRKFHVIRDYFNGLPKWDGKPRAETVFIDWLKVDDTPYARAVTINWLIAAIARIFHPGCRYRYVPVLVGEQAIGKDFIFQQLGGQWHSAISDSLDDSHALDALVVSWLAVIEEMNAANKASVNAVKSFISRHEDTRREAYARRAGRRKRQSVFAITTNDDKFLSDLTGNTRFLVLQCHSKTREPVMTVRGERLTDDALIAQIWAEAFVRYNALFADGFDEAKLTLPADITNQAADIANLYLRDDGTVEKVKTFVDTKILPPVIWDLLNREQRRKFFVEQSFTIETGVLKALFKQRRVTAQRQADFDAATAKGAFVRHIVAYDKGTRVDTTYYQFFGTVYRQHICAAEVIEEAFDRTDKRKQPAKIHEIVKRLDGWHLGKRIARDPQYGNQPVVYYRDADNIPADIDDEAATVESSEPRADKSAATADNVTVNGNGMNLITAGYNETQASTPDAQPVDEWQGEPVDEDDLPFD